MSFVKYHLRVVIDETKNCKQEIKWILGKFAYGAQTLQFIRKKHQQ